MIDSLKPEDLPRETSFWKKRPVLVTGAGGFIASHLVEYLVQQGATVRALVRYNSRGDPGLLRMLAPELFAQVQLISGDLRDLPTVQQAMRGVTHTFHLGALIAIPYSYLHPSEVVETNVIGTMNVLLAARDLQIERLIHTSTSEVYGTARQAPINENHPLQGQSPYSASKIGADKLAESFFRSYDVPVVTLRPFNTYGPRQSARAVIPTIISQALTRDTIHLGNLDATRDLTYVLDTVNGFVRVAQVAGVEGETFNLGTGKEIRIGDLANMIIELIGRQVTVVADPNRMRPEKSEVERLISDNRLAHQRLNWLPEVPLREGLKRTIDWISAHMNLYRPEQYQV